MKRFRQQHGWDSYQFGMLLGVSANTVENVEGGHQNLGRAAKLAYERLRAGELGETPGTYNANRTHGPPDPHQEARRIAAFAADQMLRAKAGELSRVLDGTIEEALVILIERELRKGADRKA